MSDLHERLSSALSERYELDREIGRGGMAVVYLATDLKQGRQVALKVFQPDVAAAMGPARFQREVEIATRLEHPHILSLYDSGEADGLLYYVMPYVKEESLRHRLDREGQLPIEDALRIAREMAEALDYAHDQGVVHRDVKPGNVLLQRGHALLADFGVARALVASGAEKLTGTGVSVGTPQYMAPEQVTGADTVDGRADVYAVGAVLYEMLTGEAPYTGSTAQAVLAKRMAGPPTPIPVLRDTVPPELDALVQKSMARSAADRWQSAGDLVRALAAAERGGTPIPGLSTWPGMTGEVTAVGREPKRGRRWAAIGVAAAAVVATVLLWGPGVLDFLTPNPDTDPFRVAVVPSRTTTATDRLAALVLGRGLDGWADLRQAEVSRVDARMAREDAQTLGPDEARTIAQDVGAGRFVLVRSEEAGDDLSVQAELYEVGDSLVRLSAVDTTASSAGFSEDWYIDVLLRLFRDQSLGKVPGLRSAEWIAEPRAMFPYYTAIALHNRGEADSAIAYLQRAVAVDSTFGVAWSYLANLASVTEPVASTDWEVRNRYIAIRDSALIYKERYYEEPVYTDQELSIAKQMADYFPDSVEAQEEVIGLYMRGALKRGWDPDSAMPYVDRLWALDSLQNWQPWVYHNLERGRVDKARALIRHSVKNDLPLEYIGLLPRFVEIIKAPTQRVRDSILFAGRADMDAFGAPATYRMIMFQDSMSIPRHVAETLLSDDQSYAHYMSFVELAAGRGSAVDTLAKDGAWPSKESFWNRRAIANVPGGIEEPREVISALRDSIAAIPVIVYTRQPVPEWAGELHRNWLLGMLSVRLGELEQAAGHAETMESLVSASMTADADSFWVLIGHDMPIEVRAAIAAGAGDNQRALDLLESVTTGEIMGPYPLPFRTFTRLLKGNLLLEEGRYAKAEGWFATFPWINEQSWDTIVLLGPAHHGRAKALDALGHYEEALHYYRRFVTRWQDADPHLQPQVEEARQRIRELEAELS